MTCAPKRGCAVLGAQIACIAFEMGPCMRDSDTTEFRTVIDEPNATGPAPLVDEHAILMEREKAGIAVCVAVAV